LINIRAGTSWNCLCLLFTDKSIDGKNCYNALHKESCEKWDDISYEAPNYFYPGCYLNERISDAIDTESKRGFDLNPLKSPTPYFDWDIGSLSLTGKDTLLYLTYLPKCYKGSWTSLPNNINRNDVLVLRVNVRYGHLLNIENVEYKAMYKNLQKIETRKGNKKGLIFYSLLDLGTMYQDVKNEYPLQLVKCP